MPPQTKSVLYIDGENLKFYIKDVLRNASVRHPYELEKIDYNNLFSSALAGISLDDKRFYSARLKVHNGSVAKSRELIEKQRALKSHLENQGFVFIKSGNVRKQTITVAGNRRVIFKEKGVDVKIAVDLVVDACDKNVSRSILCSSDSDLQPAVSELKSRGVEVIYLGFEILPNRGLTYTSDRTILLRNSEVLNAYAP